MTPEDTIDLHELIRENHIVKKYLKKNEIILDLSPDVTEKLSTELPENGGKIESILFGLGFDNLLGEMEDHRKNSFKKIVTTINSATKTTNIEILITGTSLDEAIVQEVNKRYKEGAQEAMSDGSTQEFHGSHWAGYFFQKINAVVKIENCDEGEFNVKNTVELSKSN